MKFNKFFFAILLAVISKPCYANEEFARVKYYGNIKVRIITGYTTEEINKGLIMGQLARVLSKKLNYSKPIFLDFIHRDYSPDYFISFDKGAITLPLTYMNGKEKDNLKIPGIVVRQLSRFFDVTTTLKLLEYGIKNSASIMHLQKRINYKRFYSDYEFNSIDSTLIKDLIVKPNSVLIDSTLNLKIFRPEKKQLQYGVSYYWQNNKYFIFIRNIKISDSLLTKNKARVTVFTHSTYDSVIQVVNSVYVIDEPYGYPIAIFDTDSSFYYLKQSLNELNESITIISKRNILEKIKLDWESSLFYSLDHNKSLLTLPVYFLNKPPKYRTLIYLIDRDELIQDLDVLIERR